MSGETQINSCRNCGARINGCVSCGRRVITDDVRVGVSLSPDEVARLARDTTSPELQSRLLCALGTVDRDLERRTRMELTNTEPGCATCAILTDTIDALQAELDDRDNGALDRHSRE